MAKLNHAETSDELRLKRPGSKKASGLFSPKKVSKTRKQTPLPADERLKDRTAKCMITNWGKTAMKYMTETT